MKEIPLSQEIQQLVQTLSALSNPARFKILEILAEQPQAIVSDIVERLPIAQATVSQHLKVLTDAGLIYGEREGTGQCCRIDFEAVTQFAQDILAWTMRLAMAGAQVGVKETSCQP